MHAAGAAKFTRTLYFSTIICLAYSLVRQKQTYYFACKNDIQLFFLQKKKKTIKMSNKNKILLTLANSILIHLERDLVIALEQKMGGV